MRIEKLNENKIRIFLNLEDLEEKNIDLHTFMSNSLESQDLFLDLLNEADMEVGFNTHNYRLIIEALASSDGNFIFTITRVKPDSPSIFKGNNVKLKVKRKIAKPNKSLCIYAFNTFDEFCDFCNYISTSHLNNHITKLRNASLVLFKNTYYLILNNLRFTVPELKSFSYISSEFATRVANEALLERKLLEYGKIIIPKSAISVCLKYFNMSN